MNNNIVINEQYNIGHICTKLQCQKGFASKIAVRFINAKGERKDYSYQELDFDTNRFANTLEKLGFQKGDVFFTFLPKCKEQLVSFLGALKAEVTIGSLFNNFGDEALFDRLDDSKAKGIITRKNSLAKVLRVKDRLPNLKYIFVADDETPEYSEILGFHRELNKSSELFDQKVTDPFTPSVLHYTSGSTGKPKGVLNKHKSVLHQSYTAKHVLNLNENELYWCTADPGWVTGTSYGIIGPLSLGVTQIHYEGGFGSEAWFSVLEKEKVSIWYTAPTALRMLMQDEPDVFEKFNLDHLKYIFSVGEPLNPEVLQWSRKVLNKEVYDTYFQTETGGIMITNRPQISIQSGSMGQAVPIIEAQIIDDNGAVLPVNQKGHLCIKAGWDSMFSTYLNNETLYNSKFKNGYYYTGDKAYRTEDGYFWFLGRVDDIINTGGHLVSPFEIESALLEMEEISDVAAIAAYDDILFEKIVIFVKIKSPFVFDDEMDLKIRLYVSKKVSPIAIPKEVIVRDSIPKNKSGKIMRRYLRAIYEGKDPGDISTLED